jgi:hypothetical protein
MLQKRAQSVSFCRTPSSEPGPSMTHLFRALTLMLLLAAQQGGVMHDIGHVSTGQSAAVDVGLVGASDGACALCPSFAQAASAAFGHAFHILLLGRTGPERSHELQIGVIDTALPRPRSRGPPSLS